MKNLWKVTLWAIALLSMLLVLWGCNGTHICEGVNWVTEKEATCQAEGSKKFVCSCGKAVKTESIPIAPNAHNVVDGSCTLCGYLCIEIRTVADLQNVSSNLSTNYILMNDLDLGGMEWTPIGTEDNPFTGTFDGNGHVISNFKITGDVQIAGLFGYNEGTIQNLGLESFTVDVSRSRSVYAGGLVGYSKGTITNSYAMGDVSASASYARAGGLVGCNREGTITNSYATGDVSASSMSTLPYAYAGGLVGYNNLGTITNCYRYSGQSFTVTQNGTTTHSATNTYGTATDMATLQSVDFQQNTLGWSADDWSFAAGAHPTLKNAGLTN